MKKIAFYLILFISLSYVTGCASPIQHADPFYNDNGDDFPRNHLPLIKPIEATRERSDAPWNLRLADTIWIQIPNSDADYPYSRIEELEKFAVKNDVIMAYSSYIDKQADACIQNGYYHWFVSILGKNSAKGFHTEDEFDQYIQTIGIQNPDWQTPDEAFDKFVDTGCLEWIPDCK
jgi:hypothetical protein